MTSPSSFVLVSLSGDVLQQKQATPFPSQDLWAEIQEYLAGKIEEQDKVMLFLNNNAPGYIQVGVFNPSEAHEAIAKRMRQCTSGFDLVGEGIQYHLPSRAEN